MTDAIKPQALSFFHAGVAAADPVAAVHKALLAKPLAVTTGKTLIISVGKAAVGMAKAAFEHAPKGCPAIVVTNYENATDIPGATVFAAGHPVPDENGAAAADAVIELLRSTRPRDHVLVLISGGGSALLPAPVDGVSLADKAEVSRVLLGAGIDINGMNLVRQQLSKLKGGGLLGLAYPAKVTALILSDVIGDDLRVIASGPTVAPIGTRADAISLLHKMGIWDDMPVAVQDHLERSAADTKKISNVDNRLIGSNLISVAAMENLDASAHVATTPLVGDVGEAADVIASKTGAGVWLFGGETTVRLSGSGIGGRNQELALRVALLAEDQGWSDDWVFLSGGTDGRDGPTDAAGGLVDGQTLTRMRAAGVDPRAALLDNDSYHALKASGDLLMTGATGTNVADLQVLIRR